MTSDGTHGGGSEYTTGVTVDMVNCKTNIVVASSAPMPLLLSISFRYGWTS